MLDFWSLLPTRLPEVWENGQWNSKAHLFLYDVPLPDFANFRSWHRQRLATAIRDSSKTDSGLRRELVRADESSTDGASMVVC